MILVYLLYGLAFIATGLIAGLQARLPVAVLPRRALACLAAFALVHGAAEWTVLWLLVAGHGQAFLPRGRMLLIFLLALSFGFLLQFGIELFGVVTRLPRWIRLAAAILTILVAGAAVVVAGGDGPSMTRMVEASVRYGLALGASLLSAIGLLLMRRVSSQSLTRRSRRLLVGTSFAFGAYGLFAGLIAPAAPFFPASHINTESFRALTGIPIEVFRALCALALAALLSEVFVVEASRSREDLMRLREEFISVVAHDLRSPVTTIGLTAALMEAKLADQAGAALRPQLEKICTSNRRLDRMISDLLDASRIQARQLSVSPSLTDMRELICATVDRAAAVCAGHVVRIQLPDRIPAAAVDPDRVEQVLVNLLSNAGKYAREGTEIVVGITVEADHLEVAVSNLGDAIGPKEREQLFNRFYRSKGAAQRAQGIGVGLYIARGLVEAHGGRIWVESNGGRNTFRFTLPLPSGRPEARAQLPGRLEPKPS